MKGWLCAMAETWILYQTTNNLNGRIYVGVHRLQNTSRSRRYLGSGKVLLKAIERYGEENFTRITLAEFSCADDAYLAEAKEVTEEFINLPNTYNIKLGGRGGLSVKRGTKLSEETKAKIKAKSTGRMHSAESKARMSLVQKGRVVSKEARVKMSAAQSGAKNNNSVAVMINGVYYSTRKFAGDANNVSPTTVLSRIKSDKPEWLGWRNATDEETLAHTSGEVQ
jgi:group I intron endonuclease